MTSQDGRAVAAARNLGRRGLPVLDEGGGLDVVDESAKVGCRLVDPLTQPLRRDAGRGRGIEWT